MKNILLIQLFNKFVERIEDLGLIHVSAMISQAGHNVKCCFVDEANKFDIGIIDDFRPDFVGITLHGIHVVLGLASIQTGELYSICNQIKKKAPDILIALGGKFSGDYDVEIMNECMCVDYILRGTAEKEIISLINEDTDLSEINELTFRQNGQVIKNARFNMEDYAFVNEAQNIQLVDKVKIGTICTSISCSGNCAFCNYPQVYGKWRDLNIESAIMQIEHLQKTYGIRIFEFTDRSLDNPDMNFKRVAKIANTILDKKLSISYLACFRASFLSRCDEDFLALIKKSGFVSTIVGIESGNDFDLKLYNKKITIVDIRKALQVCRDNEIIPNLGFINFNPLTSKERLMDNIKLLKEYHLSFNLIKISSSLYPLKDAALYDYFKGLNLLNTNEDDFTQSKFIFQNKDIEVLHSYLINYYLSNKNIINYVRYYFETFPMVLFDLKKCIVEADNTAMQTYIESLLCYFYKSREALSLLIYHWFCDLLNASSEQYGIVTKKYTISVKFKSVIVEFIERIGELNKELKSRGIIYNLLEDTVYSR